MAECKVRLYGWRGSDEAVDGVIETTHPPPLFLVFRDVIYQRNDFYEGDHAIYRWYCGPPEIRLTEAREDRRG